MLKVEYTPFVLALPTPHWESLSWWFLMNMLVYSLVLALINVIEQVMSNVAIEKMDPLGRKADSNNSLLVMWLANMGASFFGGMTNLDGLAKSTTNCIAGARTKVSALFVALVISVVLVFPHLLNYLPEFALAVLMLFTGWKMIAGLYNVAYDGEYAFGLSLFCAILVFEYGIFEGLLIVLAVHSFIKYVVYRSSHIPTLEILSSFVQTSGENEPHLHEAEVRAFNQMHASHSIRISQRANDRKSLNSFLKEWEEYLNRGKIDEVVHAYAPQGLLWHTTKQLLFANRQAIASYFEELVKLQELRWRFETSQIRQYDEVFIKTGTCIFSYVENQKAHEVEAEYALICCKHEGNWQIMEHFTSALPLLPSEAGKVTLSTHSEKKE